MPKYTVYLTKNAQKQLNKLSDTIAKPIIQATLDLEENPKPNGFKKLKGRDGFRIRKGDYRIIYDIYELELIIDGISLGHRKDIYD